MEPLRRSGRTSGRTAGLLVVGIAGFLLLLAGAARAEIADPTSPNFSPYQPKAPNVPNVNQASEPAQQTSPAPTESEAPAPAPAEEAVVAEVAPIPAPAPTTRPVPFPEWTPAPEAVVTRSTNVVIDVGSESPTDATGSRPSVIANGLRLMRVSLDAVIGVCADFANGMGAGGPALILAVLGAATALTRHRLFGARLVTDEEAPEMLYAWDVIAPG